MYVCSKPRQSSFIVSKLTTLPNEAIEEIFTYLDTKDLKSLSLICKKLFSVVRIYRFGIVHPIWKDAMEHIAGEGPSSSINADGVLIKNIYYVLDLSTNNPSCWLLYLGTSHLAWRNKSIKYNSKFGHFEPVKSSKATAIRYMIYVFGGENSQTEKISNILYSLDTRTMKLSRIRQSEKTVKPRFMHTLNTIDSDRIAIFGGRSSFNDIQYDINDFSVYDIIKNKWTHYTPKSDLPYSRFLHSATVSLDKLYIYGGRQKIHNKGSSKIHDDEDLWAYDIRKNNWTKYLSPSSDNFPFELPREWIPTSGQNTKPGRRSSACIFPLGKRIAMIGGSDWSDKEQETPWEYMKLFSPAQKRWEQVRVKGMPKLKHCIVLISQSKVGINRRLVIGQSFGGKAVIGWICD
ncbi:14537_t:CDS:2 [Ambispora leptoticha]|uniref:14537_t:CDS:1 n=1 Tax=Ambispora leptoticha TaxID=144679 RepID=A0A9N8VJS1_9GLOM|nr:14537_t:CDS:2 [Ambispora leptoticha]